MASKKTFLFQSAALQPQPHPFAKLSRAFGISSKDLKMATPEEMFDIEYAVMSCKWSSKWTMQPIIAATKYSPSSSFRSKMLCLLKSNSELMKPFGLFIRYALMRLRLWGEDDLSIEKKAYGRGFIDELTSENIELWMYLFSLQEFKEAKISLPPASRSRAFRKDVLIRDGGRCIVTGLGMGSQAAQAIPLAAYSWRPRKKDLQHHTHQYHACRVVALFLGAFLGKTLYSEVHRVLSTETAENGITLNLSIVRSFSTLDFYLDPLLETVERDEDTGEVIAFKACLRSLTPGFWHKQTMSTTRACTNEDRLETRTEKDMCGGNLKEKYDATHLAPDLMLKVHRLNHLTPELPLPHPGLMVFHGCISMLLVLGGVAIRDEPKDLDLEFEESCRGPTEDYDDDLDFQVKRRFDKTEWDTKAMADEVNRLCVYGTDCVLLVS
ncbi:hypothetical protein F5884DRAFT_856356 [Xylogone sp. PMI_703]|nr:hypothetical protein F5884DRAFT_856356 [Xylogone sp. PMI_703]